MARVICNYLDCVFNEDGVCSAASIEIDVESGCLTYSKTASMKLLDDDNWDDEDDDIVEESWGDYGYAERSIYDDDEDDDGAGWDDEDDDDDF